MKDHILDNTVIKVEDASILFNMASEKTDNLKEYFIKLVSGKLHFKEFWALKDISFEIKKGESWGVVGRNGAGKSTLLKLICGILAPYKGKVTIHGSIAPLIELGAGFDDNLTAEENIYLGGSILGHSKKFMREQYDEIVDFAELHEFMEMPLKNYSSGMRARIGFAIATLVKPDILIIDEVLAVGDAAFQKKCETRLNKMIGEGTTLLFVSHDNSQVKQVCKKALWLNKGKLVMTGTAEEVCDAYEKEILP
ncbi:MAG: ABC transporter ATP-binding protein [Spirochaetaceae bacterium]|nr:ABC transporter ATP-binding protein [Spirochaetaceae bacterium]